MQDKKTQSELKRLLDLQSKARHDRIFGGFSTAEQIEYDIGKTRIHESGNRTSKAQGPQQVGMTETEDQRREWNKTSESDIPSAGG